MLRFIIKRGILALVTIWIIVTITFIIMHAVPGGPFTQERPVPPAVLANLNRAYHLDEPLLMQYARYLGSLLQGDLGPSMVSATRDVNQMLADTLPVSIQLGLQALIVALIFGLSFGMISAFFHNKLPDRIVSVVAVIGAAVPSFVMAPLLIQVFAMELKWFPVARWETMKHTVLPTVALSFLPLAQITRMMRSSMLEVLQQDYIKTAKSKGLAQARVIMKHTLRNSIMPVITLVGPIAAGLLTGTFAVEKIFSVPGAGKLFVQSIENRDYPLILGTTIIYGSALVVINLLTDILYTIVDPRVKLPGKGGR
ncbi:ABC transporter permease [Paenibacillus chartarius]|uniref:ABC transporter permease n=1 Tax=Paenibacillus chartarius TaxID=747481 RepID=A0ABV6DU97_9BACL